MEEITETIALFGDIIITGGAAYIGWLFWRTYSRSGDRRSAALSAIFAIMAIYFGTLTLFAELLGMEDTFGWMESHFALEMMLMTMIISLSIVLSVKASWKGSKLTQESKDKRAA